MSATSGLTSQTPFAFYDPDGSCWRTSQGTFPWDSTGCSVTWPKRGSMRSGACSAHPTWEPPTSDCGSSLLLPTPAANEPGGTHERFMERKNRDGSSRKDTSCHLSHLVQLLPTPVVNDMGEGKSVERWDEWTAEMQAKHGNGNGHGRSLAIEAMRLLPTPTSQAAKHSTDDRGPGTLDDFNLWSVVSRLVPTDE